MKLLIDEPPLVVLPTLACLLGVEEALFLQQVHFWLQKSKHVQGGKCWIYNSYREWQKQFPFFSAKKIQRLALSLEKKGILVSGNFNKIAYDKTKWYRIDYEALNALLITNTPQSGVNNHWTKTDDDSAKNGLSSSVFGTIDDPNLGSPIPNITQNKKTQEKNTGASPENGTCTLLPVLEDPLQGTKKKGKDNQAEEGIQTLLEVYKELLFTERNINAFVEYGRDSKILKDLLAVYGFAKLKTLLKRYIKLEDPYLKTKAYPLTSFRKSVNELLSAEENSKHAQLGEEILSYLNQRAGKTYQTDDATLSLIADWTRKGKTIEDFKKVIDNMTAAWLHDPKMSYFLRPSTLFGQKMEGYIHFVSKNGKKPLQHATDPDKYKDFEEVVYIDTPDGNAPNSNGSSFQNASDSDKYKDFEEVVYIDIPNRGSSQN